MPHVIHATDLSGGDEPAFLHALALALVHRARLTLIHAGDPGEGPVDWSRFPGVRPRLAAWGLLREGADKHEVAEALGIHVRKVAAAGRDPVAVIQEAMAQHPVDVLVLGHDRSGGLWPFARRSVSGELARAALVPTLVIPGDLTGFVSPADGSLRIERVLVPVDDTPDPRRALHTAGALLRDMATPGCTVELFHAGDRTAAPQVTEADVPGAVIIRRSEPGDPPTEILRRAGEMQPDVIVMAAEGKRSLADRFYGTVTEQVLRLSPSPVLA
ncbi:MAG: universal stress protein, partial [Pseudomonadota bacterium]